MADALLRLFPYQLTHFLISLLAGYLVYRQSKNEVLTSVGAKPSEALAKKGLWYIFIAVLTGTLLIDLDHWIDFYLYIGQIISPLKFFGSYFFCPSGKMYVLFHAWEYLPIIYFVTAKIFKKKYLAWTLILTMAGHLVFDQITNGTHPGTYFITWRIIKDFDIFQTTWGCGV